MGKKEIKLHMGFVDKNGNLVEIPENIQKFIEERENHWFKEMIELENKYKKQFEQCKQDAELIAQLNSGLAKMVTEKEHKLSLTEKALEQAVDYMFKELKLDGYQDIHWDGSDLTLLQENIDCFLEQAEEMMKSGT